MRDHVAAGGKREEMEAADLLIRVAQGEPGAVRACVDTFGALVWSLALRSSPSREDAETMSAKVKAGSGPTARASSIPPNLHLVGFSPSHAEEERRRCH